MFRSMPKNWIRILPAVGQFLLRMVNHPHNNERRLPVQSRLLLPPVRQQVNATQPKKIQRSLSQLGQELKTKEIKRKKFNNENDVKPASIISSVSSAFIMQQRKLRNTLPSPEIMEEANPNSDENDEKHIDAFEANNADSNAQIKQPPLNPAMQPEEFKIPLPPVSHVNDYKLTISRGFEISPDDIENFLFRIHSYYIESNRRAFSSAAIYLENNNAELKWPVVPVAMQDQNNAEQEWLVAIREQEAEQNNQIIQGIVLIFVVNNQRNPSPYRMMYEQQLQLPEPQPVDELPAADQRYDEFKKQLAEKQLKLEQEVQELKNQIAALSSEQKRKENHQKGEFAKVKLKNSGHKLMPPVILPDSRSTGEIAFSLPEKKLDRATESIVESFEMLMHIEKQQGPVPFVVEEKKFDRQQFALGFHHSAFSFNPYFLFIFIRFILSFYGAPQQVVNALLYNRELQGPLLLLQQAMETEDAMRYLDFIPGISLLYAMSPVMPMLFNGVIPVQTLPAEPVKLDAAMPSSVKRITYNEQKSAAPHVDAKQEELKNQLREMQAAQARLETKIAELQILQQQSSERACSDKFSLELELSAQKKAKSDLVAQNNGLKVELAEIRSALAAQESKKSQNEQKNREIVAPAVETIIPAASLERKEVQPASAAPLCKPLKSASWPDKGYMLIAVILPKGELPTSDNTQQIFLSHSIGQGFNQYCPLYVVAMADLQRFYNLYTRNPQRNVFLGISRYNKTNQQNLPHFEGCELLDWRLVRGFGFPCPQEIYLDFYEDWTQRQKPERAVAIQMKKAFSDPDLKEMQALIADLKNEIEKNEASMKQPRYFFQRDAKFLAAENDIKRAKMAFLLQLEKEYHNPQKRSKNAILNEVINKQSDKEFQKITFGAFSRTFSLMQKLGYQENPVSLTQQARN